MSEISADAIKVHLENIRNDVSKLQVGYERMTELMGRLVYIEDRFKANDESHRIIWDKLNRNTDTIQKREPIIETVISWKKNFNKLTVGAITLGVVEMARIFFMLYKGMK